MQVKSLHFCPTLCDTMDCSPPGSSAHGILQARILEWVAIPFSRGSFWPRGGTPLSASPSPALPGGPFTTSTTWEVNLQVNWGDRQADLPSFFFISSSLNMEMFVSKGNVRILSIAVTQLSALRKNTPKTTQQNRVLVTSSDLIYFMKDHILSGNTSSGLERQLMKQ